MSHSPHLLIRFPSFWMRSLWPIARGIGSTAWADVGAGEFGDTGRPSTGAKGIPIVLIERIRADRATRASVCRATSVRWRGTAFSP